MKKRGWIGSNAYKGEGKIKNENGVTVYKVKGKWNTSFSTTKI